MASPTTDPSADEAGLLERVRHRFRTEFGVSEPEAVAYAPGRVNLIGAHLDYNGGDVLPVAVDRGVFVAARRRSDDLIRLRSIDQELAVDLRTDEVGDAAQSVHGWAVYPLGVWREFARETGITDGCDLLYGGNLPIASGLSSSAAIEVATAAMLDRLHGTGLPMLRLAQLSHVAETGYVGLKCGIMDQFASALGRSGHALLLHCADSSFEHVEIHGSGFEIMVLDTRKPRELAESNFNRRVAECATAHAVLRREVRDLPHLALYQTADLDAAGTALAGTPRLRATHVVDEMARVKIGVQALRDGDIVGLGRQLDASHASTAGNYAVSCRELDVITDAARSHPSVFGARLTGAGFGGCAIALIETGSSASVAAHCRAIFEREFGVTPTFRVAHTGDGPRVF